MERKDGMNKPILWSLHHRLARGHAMIVRITMATIWIMGAVTCKKKKTKKVNYTLSKSTFSKC